MRQTAGGCLNVASGACSFIGGGCGNKANATGTGILGGISNCSGGHGCSFIVGTGICAQATCTTFVNNLAFYAHDNQTSKLATSATAGERIFVGSTSVTAGNMYYLAEPVSGTSSWALTDADAVSSSTNMLAIAAGTGNSNDVGMLVRGFARFTSVFSLTGGTMGAPLYLGTSPGAIQTSAPSDAGDVVRIIGYLIDDTTETVYFCPDNTWVEL